MEIIQFLLEFTVVTVLIAGADRHLEGFSSLFTFQRIALELGDLH